jgi:phenylalanyl-tRNA synthetase beta chain
MLISINWVREHCPFETDETPQEIANRFLLATAEVESVAVLGDALDRFVVARVQEVHPVPKADKLTRVIVDIGEKDPVTVVCGAPNVAEGLRVPYAGPGTTVRGKKLSKAKIRGVESAGMLLSEAEIGISDFHEQLLELAADLEPGTPLKEVLPNYPDVVLEVENKTITHRPDLWGHYGIAREFSTIYRTPLAPYVVDESLASGSGDAGIAVSIEDDGDEKRPGARRRCFRYCGLRIEGVQVGPSPAWLQQRLAAVGSRPINNIVDITNLILFELGQPLHAFDADRVRGGQIVVRMPTTDEKMTLLDGRTIDLHPSDLVIADAEGPMALAGVMGGDGSQIGDDTTSIFLESANFLSTSVRLSSTRHGRTDSSSRFEKSLDPTQARTGILRAARRVLELCPGARVVGALQDVGFEPSEPIDIDLEPASIPRRLGCDLSDNELRETLEHLGFDVEEAKSGKNAASRWKVTVPSWRSTGDVSNRDDLVEEVGRIYGYHNIEPFAPQWPVRAPVRNDARDFERQVKAHLASHCDLIEVFTYPMVGETHCEAFGIDPEACLTLRNSMSREHDRMRREIVPIHLEKAAENQRFGHTFGLFEVGRVYRREERNPLDADLPLEKTRVVGALSFAEKSDENFQILRHVILSLVDSFRMSDARVEALGETDAAWIHPAVAGRLLLGERDAGSFYRVHPDVGRKLELAGDVLAFDLDFDVLFEASRDDIKYRHLPRFPDVPFDVTILAPERTPVAQISTVIREAAGKPLHSLEVFSVYQGKGVGEGQKSTSFHMVFRADDHTLEADEVERLQNQVIDGLAAAGYPLK